MTSAVAAPPTPSPASRSRSVWAGVRGSALRAWPALAGFVAVRAVGVLWLAHKTHKLSLDTQLTTRFDASYYVNIARYGYTGPLHGVCSVQGPQCRYAFFPLYPGLIRVAHAVLPGSAGNAALTIATISSVIAAWGIFAVTELVAGRRAGIYAALLWGVVPHAIVESMAYSEPLFVALAAWGLYCVLKARWELAGLLAILAGLTRPSGVAVVAAVEVGALIALWQAWRGRGTSSRGRLLAVMVLAPTGWLSWIAYVGYQLNAWNGYQKVQKRWFTGFDSGHYTVNYINKMLRGAPSSLDTMEVSATLVCAVVLLVICLLQAQRWPLVTYSVVLMALAIGTSGYFNAKSRFLLPAFPLLIPVAVVLARTRRSVAATVIVTAAACSAVYGGYLLTAFHASP